MHVVFVYIKFVNINNMKIGLVLLITCFNLTEAIVGQDNASSRDLKELIICHGIERNYVLHLPPIKANPLLHPLLIVLHGGGGDAKGMQKLTQWKFDSLANHDRWLVLYPNGVEKHWNDARRGDETGYTVQEKEIDDVGFISDLIDKMVKERNADPLHVYITGMSNGAMMTYRCGCELSNKIAAIAPVAGNIPLSLSSFCKPGRPLSVLAINGMKDPLMPYNGGEVTGPFGRKKLGKVLSANESILSWVKFDACSITPDRTELPDKDSSDGTRISKASYNGGSNNTEVILITVEGGGHAWPEGYPYLGEWIIGKTSRDMNACEEIWEFFKRH